MKGRKLLDIMPECYVDTNLIEYLLDAGVNHQHCCSKVVGQLNTTFSDRFAVGIIDKDKVEMGYLKECEEIAKTKHLTLLHHKTRPQYLITVSPAIDRFILDCAETEGINTEDFDIPGDLKGFTRLSKSITSNTDSRFKALFRALKDNPEIIAMRATLEYMCEERYTMDGETLQELFKTE